MELRCREHVLTLDRTLIMGVLNVTPDSFSDGGRYLTIDAAVEHAGRMVEEGADLIDVGGESSRPGAEGISAAEECDRILPVIERIRDLGVPISVDSCKSEVVRAALERGAHMINDITGLGEEMLEVAAEFAVPAVAMHMQGTPRTMQHSPRYDDVVAEVVDFLAARKHAAAAAGVQVVLDPGIGFGKTLEHNLELLRHLDRLRPLGAPILVGASRKAFLGRLAGDEGGRLEASIAAHVAAALRGADLVRVHDVAPHRRALAIADALRVRPGMPRRERVFARGVRCRSRIGVDPEERRHEQELVIDLEVEVERQPGSFGSEAGPQGDVLDGAVDYTRLATIAREEAASRPRQLLETLAEELVHRLLRELPVREVRVRVEKPAVGQALGGGQFGVEVLRHR